MSLIPVIKQPGRVIGAGKMQKTVKVELTKQIWHKYLRKHYNISYNLLVHDPNGSVNEGDVITMAPELHSKRVRYTVSSIVSAFGTPVSERAPIFTEMEREQRSQEQRQAKLLRRARRGITSAIEQLTDMGITPPPQTIPEVGDRSKLATNESVKQYGRKVLAKGARQSGNTSEVAHAAKRGTARTLQGATSEEIRRQKVERDSQEVKAQAALNKKSGEAR